MDEIKNISQNGIDFIAKEEGCVLHPYKDIAGIPTIGIGNTYYATGIKVTMHDPPITKDEAYALFSQIVKHYEEAVWSLTRDDINQNNFDSLVSFSYNVGIGSLKSSTLLKRINANPKDQTIRQAFEMWNKAENPKTHQLEVSDDLSNRRAREADLYFTPIT